jgi:fatty acid desaturase
MTQTDVLDEVVASSPEQLREQALRRVKKRRDLHTHAFAYLTINVLLWGVWAIIGATSHSWFPWPLWVTLGWGIGLAFNAWDVYFRRPITEAELQQEMERLQRCRVI